MEHTDVGVLIVEGTVEANETGYNNDVTVHFALVSIINQYTQDAVVQTPRVRGEWLPYASPAASNGLSDRVVPP